MSSTNEPPKVEMVKDYPKQVFPDPPARPPEYLAYLEKAAMALRSIRLIVYAGLGAFVLLAAYGFFLIYLLTSYARTMAEQTQFMSARMEAISQQMRAVTAIMGDMREDIDKMPSDLSGMRAEMGDMRTNLQEMNRHVAAVEISARQMSLAVTLMQYSARNLDANVGPAMGAMNSFMPFGGGRRGAPPFAPLPR